EAVSETSSLGIQPPFDHVASLNGITFADLAPGRLSPFSAALPQPPLNLLALAQAYRPPQSQQFSGGFQVAPCQETTLEVNYVGARGKYLGRNRNINQVPDAFRAAVVEDGLNPDLVRPYLGYSRINLNERVGTSAYNSLQVFLSRRMSAGLQLQASY